MIGYIHNKMIIHSLFVNPHADGKSGEVFVVHKTFLGYKTALQDICF